MDEINEMNSFDLFNIQNKFAKRILEITVNKEILWTKKENNFLKTNYITFEGIGTKGKAVNFKFSLNISMVNEYEHYLLFNTKYAVNDWCHLYGVDDGGYTYQHEEQILFIKNLLTLFVELGIIKNSNDKNISSATL